MCTTIYSPMRPSSDAESWSFDFPPLRCGKVKSDLANPPAEAKACQYVSLQTLPREAFVHKTAITILSAAAILCADEVQYPTMIQWNGTRGLSQTRSAEGLGEGFLTISAVGTGYEVNKSLSASSPAKGTDVGVGTFSLGLGLSDWADLTGWISGYGTSNGNGTVPNPSKGLGASGAQLQLSNPLDSSFPFRVAVQGGLIAGTSESQIQLGTTPSGYARADGWNYYETRTGYDLQLRMLQTLRTGGVSFPLRILANEGLTKSIESRHDMYLMFDGGLELDPLPALTIALEGHTRTRFSNYDPARDPTWGTASFTFHLPGNVQFQVGGDLAFSKQRNDSDIALDPWRAFVGVSVGFDLAADAKAAKAEARRNDSLEHIALKAKIAQQQTAAEAADAKAKRSIDSLIDLAKHKDELHDTLVRKAKSDSIRQALELEACLLEGNSSKNRAAHVRDSLNQRSSQDSAALAEARRLIEEERLKRGDLEASFLRTGMLNLDAVYFDMGKSTITANSRPYLNLIGAILVKYPKLRFEVGGHTDNKGKPKTNLNLSQARATAVQKYFIQIHPDLDGKIVAKGYGDTKPKATNKTPAGREMNRRVEITVLNLDVLKEYTQQNGVQAAPAAPAPKLP
jgi:outer membrane protein OmpA-like peptidoglycan-associated protein